MLQARAQRLIHKALHAACAEEDPWRKLDILSYAVDLALSADIPLEKEEIGNLLRAHQPDVSRDQAGRLRRLYVKLLWLRFRQGGDASVLREAVDIVRAQGLHGAQDSIMLAEFLQLLESGGQFRLVDDLYCEWLHAGEAAYGPGVPDPDRLWSIASCAAGGWVRGGHDTLLAVSVAAASQMGMARQSEADLACAPSERERYWSEGDLPAGKKSYALRAVARATLTRGRMEAWGGNADPRVGGGRLRRSRPTGECVAAELSDIPVVRAGHRRLEDLLEGLCAGVEDDEARAVLFGCRACLHMGRGDLDGAFEMISRMEGASRIGRPSLAVDWLRERYAIDLVALARRHRRPALLVEAAILADRIVDAHCAARAWSSIAIEHFMLGEQRAGEEAMARAVHFISSGPEIRGFMAVRQIASELAESSDVTYLSELGRRLFAAGQKRRGLELLSLAASRVELDPESAPFLASIAAALQTADAAALKHAGLLARSITREEEQAEAVAVLARAYAELGQRAYALGMLRRANAAWQREDSGEGFNARLRIALGLSAIGAPEEAVNIMAQLVNMQTDGDAAVRAAEEIVKEISFIPHEELSLPCVSLAVTLGLHYGAELQWVHDDVLEAITRLALVHRSRAMFEAAFATADALGKSAAIALVSDESLAFNIGKSLLGEVIDEAERRADAIATPWVRGEAYVNLARGVIDGLERSEGLPTPYHRGDTYEGFQLVPYWMDDKWPRAEQLPSIWPSSGNERP